MSLTVIKVNNYTRTCLRDEERLAQKPCHAFTPSTAGAAYIRVFIFY